MNNLRYFTTSILLMLLAASARGQSTGETKELELPDCDIFLFDFSETSGAVSVSSGRNITDRPGYDNQPWFTPDSKSLLFSANREPGRTDIYEYLFDSSESKQITDSPTQEYSPQISPDNRVLSFVTDGAAANQSIWYQDRGNPTAKWLLSNQSEREPVGYYSWNHKTDYILFWSRYGFSMRLVHKTKELSHYITGDAVPTSPHIIPGTDRFSFMHRQGNGEVWIKELDPETLAIRPLTSVIGNSRNYGWTPRGDVLMFDGTKLNRWSPASDAGWEFVADLDSHGMRDVTRVVVSPNGKRLAVVGLSNKDG